MDVARVEGEGQRVLTQSRKRLVQREAFQGQLHAFLLPHTAQQLRGVDWAAHRASLVYQHAQHLGA